MAREGNVRRLGRYSYNWDDTLGRGSFAEVFRGTADDVRGPSWCLFLFVVVLFVCWRRLVVEHRCGPAVPLVANIFYALR